MRLNPFFGDSDGLPPVPDRIYARLEDVTAIVETPNDREPTARLALFDGLDAHWFDDWARRPREYAEREEFFWAVPLTVVEVIGRIKDLPRYGILLSLLTSPKTEEGDPHWLELSFKTVPPPDADAHVYRAFADPPNPRKLLNIDWVGQATAARLDAAFSLDSGRTGDPGDIAQALSRVGHVEFAAVYDVGQGSCAGLCSPDSSVRAYFDFGGGIFRNKRTFPEELRAFCFTHRPPIILSHWDFDHWSSVHRDHRAFHADWIVPFQQRADGTLDMGVTHVTFAAHVDWYGRLLWWPTGTSSIAGGQITVEKCTGRGRNNSGLAVILSEPTSPITQDMLFPGDARYEVIPSHDELVFTSIATPHHGADMHDRLALGCPRLPHSRLVYSYGKENSYEHPRMVTRQDHHREGWLDDKVAQGVTSIVRETANRPSPQTPGHVMLRWGDLPAQPPSLACDGRICQLRLVQM